MILSYNENGTFHSLLGYRKNYSQEKIDDLPPIESYGNLRIYDTETISSVWRAYDTGGVISVELDEEKNVIGIITENGDLEPPEDVPFEPEPTEAELIKQRIIATENALLSLMMM